MCGIVGMAGWIDTKLNSVFKDLLFLDAVRGWDSTGVMQVNLSNKVIVDKEVGGPESLFSWRKSPLLNVKGEPIGVSHKVMLGHNRKATVGDINKESAHPFTYGNITGVHNGTLYSYQQLPNADSFDIDSQALINSIDKQGIEKTWVSFYGAAALVWWDEKEKLLNFIRNDERPMHFGVTKDGRTLIWASEPWMIIVACSRNKVELMDKSEKEGDPPKFTEQTSVNHHYAFEVTANSFKRVKKEKMEDKYLKNPTNIGVGISYNKTYPGFFQNNSKKKKGKAINQHGFCQNLRKVDKNYLNITAKLLAVSGEKVILCTEPRVKGEKVFRIEAYPSHQSELETWQERMIRVKEGVEFYFKVVTRPRLSNVFVNGIMINWVMSTKGLLLEKTVSKIIPFNKNNDLNTSLVYKTYGDSLVSALRWKELVSELAEGADCCSSCGDRLDITDHLKYVWPTDKICLCETCSVDPTILDYYHSYGYFKGN